MKKYFTLKNYIYISLFWLALEFCWQALTTVILPSRILFFVPDVRKGSALALIFSMGALISVLAQPVVGALSDYSTHPMGRRRPFLILGTILLSLALLLFTWSNSYAMLFISMILIFTASDMAQAPCQGFIPDLVPQKNRGKASGFMGLATILGAIVGPMVAGFLIGVDKFFETMILIISFLVLFTIITVVKVKEERFIPSHFLILKEKFKRAFEFRVKEFKDFYWLLLSRFFILLALTTMLVYFLYFLKDVIKVENPARSTGIIMTIAATAALIAILPASVLSDKIGRKSLLYYAGALGSVAIVPLIFATTFTQVIFTAIFFGASFGMFSGTQWALTVDLIPEKEAGKFLGYTQFSTSSAQILAPMLAGPIIDLSYSAGRLGYQIIYLLTLF
ncbi:MAG: MFS transporter, partial [Candidatus Subteraquimicrobiales bacterium]|nr:MFS transporter [Candidatus Subteraquimicrobiales bacterium]